MKRVKSLIRRVANAYLKGSYNINKPFIDVGLTPFC